jgi:putative alpha-1,2-mannosidase
MRMNPAKSILDLIGYDKAAEITRTHISRVYRWTYPAGARQGTGGVIPHAAAIEILRYARDQHLPISEADFMQAPTVAGETEQAGAA